MRMLKKVILAIIMVIIILLIIIEIFYLYEVKKKNWKEKHLHGEFNRLIEETRTNESWMLLEKSILQKKTEAMTLDTQEQAYQF